MAKKKPTDEWRERLEKQHAEWDRLAAIAEEEHQAWLNSHFPASEGWIGSEQRWGYRIRARDRDNASLDYCI